MLEEALNRTILLMQTELRPGADPARLLAALTGVRVTLKADRAALATYAGQCAYVTAALTMARSGHEIWLGGEETPLVGAQPPLADGLLFEQLLAVGRDLLPGCAFRRGTPDGRVDLAVVIGAPDGPVDAAQIAYLDADAWSGSLAETPHAWGAQDWPAGGMAAGALAAGEAFKAAMRAVRDLARTPDVFDDMFAPCHTARIALAPADTPQHAALGDFDLVSGGAIANAALFVLLRLPGVKGSGRVIDHDRSGLSNLNRNALLRRSALAEFKVDDLARFGDGLDIRPEPVRFEGDMALGRIVLVGVDDIPSRWRAQAAGPAWLGVGGTDRFMVQVSEHRPADACAGCLHPAASDNTDPIPTVAFVSFWSGLLLAVRLLRMAGGTICPPGEQQRLFTTLRPESWNYTAYPVAPNANCPVGCGAATSMGDGSARPGLAA
ncbi:MAG: hypothetical protein JWQ46_1966 [Phenylobacterium sp.]|nr:hypothetical protein [Phenylobacterium sp.]